VSGRAAERRDPAVHCIVALRIGGRRCLVVGGGAVAGRKVRGALACGGAVTVVAPEAIEEIRRAAAAGSIGWERRRFEAADLGGAMLVFAATDDCAVNAQVADAAAARGALVNVADAPELSDFIVPAVVHEPPFSVAVTSNGATPALTRRLREELEANQGRRLRRIAGLFRRLVERGLARGEVERCDDVPGWVDAAVGAGGGEIVERLEGALLARQGFDRIEAPG
jgi:precorrin-2 dehydrogenase/sirohydrochlorin ferrochelatase